MWSRKRVLKKHKNQIQKKRILLVSLVLGVIGLSTTLLGVYILKNEPLYISPIVNTNASTSDSNDTNAKKQIEQFLKEQEIPYEEIVQLGSHTYVITVEEHGDVYITSGKEIGQQLSSLQQIYSRLTMEGKRFKRLDVRFDRPVIVVK